MTPKIQRLVDGVPGHLGEGPHWDAETQSLYYVDIMDKTIHKYTPSTKTDYKAYVGPKQVSFIIPVEGENNHYVISLAKEVVKIFWDGQSDTIKILEKLGEVDTTLDLIHNRFNDAKCDPTGRLWAGTLNTVAEGPLIYPAKGILYSMDPDKKIRSHLTKLRISNGMAFNDELKKMYHIDSSKKTVDQYDIDTASGTISNCQSIFSLENNHIPGIPDGMTIDADSNLWVAIFNGGRVIKIDPRKRDTLLDVVQIPAKQVTSVAFGGVKLDELYVTTGAFQLEDEDLTGPENGGLYRVTGIGVRGLPAVKVHLKSH